MWDLIVSVPDHCLSFYSRQNELNLTNEPAHEIMATSEGSGEPAHPRCLARAFAVRTQEICK